LELFDDPEMDEETKATALDMIRSSAKTAGAKLKFCRIAFGAAGTAGALIDLSEAGEVARAFVGEEKVKLDWQAPRENRPKQQVKLLLNMLLLAIAGIPRGGIVTVAADGDNLSVRASGERAKISEPMAEVLAGTADLSLLDARLVQPYYSKQLAASAGLELTMAMSGDDVLVQARAA
jgi:histidine phosphotransferase ChpT